ncbi:MAG: hypothetical protein SF028_14305 [Candidatus Sumerlaeia bacterium]|nr:hypothetical protein [Candidatus Sumerlaeia bacterium]
MTGGELDARLERRVTALVRVLLLVLALAHLWGAFPAFRYAANAVAFPYSLDREEGYLAAQARAVGEGHTIYPPIANRPWLVGNYPPTYPIGTAALASATGSELAAGRALSLLSALAALSLLGAAVWRATRQAELALLAAGHAAASWDWMSWLPYARVDFLAVGLAMGGLAAFLSAPARTRATLAGVLFCAAFFAKQTQLAAPAAVMVAMLAAGDRRGAFRFAAGTAGAALALLGVLVAITGGEAWRHLVEYNRNEFTLAQVRVWLRHWLFFEGAAMAALLVAMAGIAARGRCEPSDPAPQPSDPATTVLLAYGVLAALTFAAAGKAGAAENYLIEPQLGLGALLALALHRLCLPLEPGSPRWLRALNPAALLLVFLLLLGKSIPSERPGPLSPLSFSQRWATLGRGAAPDPLLSEAGARAELAVRAADGEVLSEDAVLLLRAGRPVFYQPFIMSQLAREGVWDSSAFDGALWEGRFALVVATQDLATEEFLLGFTEMARTAILSRYRLVDAFAVGRTRYFLWEPRPEGEAPW